METWKYRSPLRGDKTSNNRWIGPKGQAALALAVSLWIGGSGVAVALGTLYLKVDNNDTLYQFGTPPTEATISNSGKTLTITGGNWNNDSWIIKGGSSNGNNVSGYTLKLSNVQGTFSAEGGNTSNAIASRNTVEGINIKTTEVIRGALSASGQTDQNTVVLKNSTVSNVYGGEGHTATNNSVMLENTTANNVYGGYTYSGTGDVTGNMVTLNNATVNGSLYGGGTNEGTGNLVTGNTLNLSSANTAGAVQNFATININSATWGTSALTLTGDGIVQNADGSTYATINTQNVAFSGAPTTGTTTLISSTNVLPDTLKVFTGTTTKATITTAGVVVKQDATPTESKANGVTLAYRNTHTVALAADSKSITYNIANPVSTIALGSIDWVKDGTARTLTTEEKALLTFNSDTDIDKTGFAFTNPLLVGAGESMTLLANATLAEMAATENNVSFSYAPVAGVTMDGKILGSYASSGGNLTYTATANQATKLTFGVNSNNVQASIPWNTTAPYYDLSGKGYGFTFDGTTAIDASKLTFTGLDQAKAGDAMTLLANAAGITGDHITQPSDISYEYSPLSGVMINGAVTGQIAVDSSNVNYQVTGNNASKLTFGNVVWKDTGALMTRPSNITFNGVAVDTSNINFTNIKELEANKKMTLVSSFGDTVGTITGTKYKVGSTLEGTGKASLSGNDLIFTAETGTSQEQTHNTVMGAEVGMAALSAGNDFVVLPRKGWLWQGIQALTEWPPMLIWVAVP